MANTTISPNMNLPLPIVGVDPGPDYGNQQNAAFSIIDSHNHAAGSGVQINPNGININANLTFGGFSATNLFTAVFSSQPSALTGTNFLSFIGGNLYVNDGSGNQIPITASGGVAGSPGSIGSLVPPAAATYSAGSKTFTWTADSSKAAAMDNGAVTIRETNVASAKGVTIASASGLAADYQFTLPAGLPASTQYLTSNASGVLSFSTSNQIAVAATRATGTSVGTGGVAISASSGNFTTTGSLVNVTNLSVTIVTSGRPVSITLIPDGTTTANLGIIALGSRPNDPSVATFSILRDGSVIGACNVLLGISSLSSNAVSLIAPAAVAMIDTGASAASHIYSIQASGGGSVNAGSAAVNNCKLVVYEL